MFDEDSSWIEMISYFLLVTATFIYDEGILGIALYLALASSSLYYFWRWCRLQEQRMQAQAEYYDACSRLRAGDKSQLHKLCDLIASDNLRTSQQVIAKLLVNQLSQDSSPERDREIIRQFLLGESDENNSAISENN